MATVAEVIKSLQDNKSDDLIAAHIWIEEDLDLKLYSRNLTATRDQKAAIFDRMNHEVDSELGMSWDFMDECIDAVLEEGENHELS